MNIRDIALMASVSPSTVSKILNKKDEAISDKTRQKVLDIVKKHNYMPYNKPISLRNIDKNYQIALLLNIDDSTSVPIKAIQSKASLYFYDLVLCNQFGDLKIEKEKLRHVLSKNHDGLIWFASLKDKEHDEILGKTDFPIVVANYMDENNTNKNIKYVSKDYSLLTKEAVKYCVQKGLKKIGLVLRNSKNEQRTKKLIDGYKYGHSYSNLTINKNLILSDLNFEKLINNDTEIIICEDEVIVKELYKYCEDYKIRIGEDISIICISKNENEKLEPKLTYIYQDEKKYCETLVEGLIAKIEGREHKCFETYKSEVITEEGTSVSNGFKDNRIVVVGSLNIDTILRMPFFPAKGDSLIIDSVASYPGGKGANQAVGVAKLGARPYLIGCVGKDREGRDVIENLKRNNVSLEGIVTDGELSTGQAYITLLPDGESSIYVYRGANSKLTANKIKSFSYLFDNAKFCLVSTELDMVKIKEAIDLAYKKQVKIILKPATVDEIPDELLKKTYIIAPNEAEAERLFPNITIEEKAEKFISKGVRHVIITLGAKGAYYKNEKESKYYPAEKMPIIDTTGGADAFISALAVFLLNNKDMDSAIKFANYAAGVSITREGVQNALVTKEQIEGYVNLS